jgi:uncharacterized membrane protein
MQKQNRTVYFLCQSALIAAAYAVLTLAAAALGWAYGPIQFRFSEALTILPALTPAAVPGLAVGCFLSNLGSPLGPVDWIFGTLATLLAALWSRSLRHIKVRGIPVLAPLPPVICNAVIIGLEIACLGDSGFSMSGFSMAAFLPNALYVGLGELVICYGLGLPLLYILEHALQKNSHLKTLFPQN